MKIGSPADTPPLAPTAAGRTPSGEAAVKTPAAPATPSTAEASAQVEISSAAATLMKSVDASSAEFDADKVARISQAVADGSFKVDPAAIADKLIANAQELLTRASN